MPKSRAEIQKAYRQRLKQKNEAEYLMKERDRMRRNYVPASELSENDRKQRNAKVRQRLRRFYERKKLARTPTQSLDIQTSGYESEEPSTAAEKRGRLRVRLNFQSNRRKGAIKRWKRELSEAKSRIQLLEQERDEWVKKCRTTQRRLQRNLQKEATDLTPRKETETLMEAAKLTQSQKDKIRKPLLLGNVLAKEVKDTKAETPKRYMKAVHRVVSGRILKKYKCTKLLAEKTGLCRHKLGNASSKTHQIRPSTRRGTVYRYRREVEDFMKREDNSRMQPGKADAKRIDSTGVKAQTYILSDYLCNLFHKFKCENPTARLSFASFCRIRPKNLLTAAFGSRNTCLCTKHQNAA